MRIPPIFVVTAGRALVSLCFGQLFFCAVIVHLMGAFGSFAVTHVSPAPKGEVSHQTYVNSIDGRTLVLAQLDERTVTGLTSPKVSVLFGSSPEAMSSPAPLRAGGEKKEQRKFVLGLVDAETKKQSRGEFANRLLLIRVPGFEVIGVVGLVAAFVKLPRKRSGGTITSCPN